MLPAFAHATRNSTLAALISDDPAKLKRLGRRYAVPHLAGYDDAQALFASGEIDAVYIALPNTLHLDWTERAADAGLHVLCEKPMAPSVRACERMLQAAGRNRVRLMIAYRLQFERANLEVAQLVRAGKLGAARYFDAQFSMQVKPGNIRTRADLAGGPLNDIGIYCINAARSVFAAEPLRVFAVATHGTDARFRHVPESVIATLQFPDDRIATFSCSFGAADRGRYEVVGTRGSVVLEPAFTYAGNQRYEVQIGERRRVKEFGRSDQFAAELLHFSDCVITRREPGPSGVEGLADVAVIEALEKAQRRGRWVEVRQRPLRALARRLRRPTLRQEIRRPPVPREPKLVRVAAPH